MNLYERVLRDAAEVRARRQAAKVLGLCTPELDRAAMLLADEAIEADWAERRRLAKREARRVARERQEASKAAGSLGGIAAQTKRDDSTT